MRIIDRLEELYAIGGGVGANRLGRSPEEDRAHELAAGWMEEAGLAVEVDPTGNLIGRTARPDVWTGSHLDSVPNGGKFDGALGVVAGIEAVERVGRGAVVAFRDEETGCHGSTAFVQRGELPGAPLGIVTGITGMVRGERAFRGLAGHAGTVPMAARDDALVAACAYVLRVRDTAARVEGAVATVGRLEVDPGAGNVIPAAVRLSVDARAPDRERLDRLVAELDLHPSFRLEPQPMADEPVAALRAEVGARGLPLIELHSGAGHDAAILAGAGVPTAMLFVRSLNGGISHSPDETTSDEDVAVALDVLAGALARLA